MNIAITAPRRGDVSFSTNNRIADIIIRKDDGMIQLYVTYEVAHNFPSARVMPRSWLVDNVSDGRFDMLMVLGYHKEMAIIKAAEKANIDIILFKEW